MDNSNMSDDEIELLNPPTGEDGSVGDDHSQLYVNPIHLLHRGPSEDDSISLASYHALHTAVTSMQHKLNDKTKKYNELLQKNKLMQKALYDMSKQAGSMDNYSPPESSIVHAAGAGCSSEDESVIAEQRAKQGYISHLEREVLRNTGIIARANEESQRLKKRCDQLEAENKALLQKLDNLQTDKEIESRTSGENARAQHIKIEELEQRQKYLFEENVSLKEQLNKVDRNSLKDAELRDLRNKLVIADNEMTKLTRQYRELDNKMQEKEKELSMFQSKCKQYDIEAEINRKRRFNEGLDDVDGDTDILKKALDMIQSQRNEVTSLKDHIQQQQNVIKDLVVAVDTAARPVCKCQGSLSEERGVAQGASIHFQYEETRSPQTTGSPGLVNTHFTPENFSSQAGREVSPLARRQSDRTEYRAKRQSPSPRRTTSPRVREAFVPTGNKLIPEMIANEDTNFTQQALGTNVFDNISKSPGLSPRIPASPQPVYMNIPTSSKPDSPRQGPETRVRSSQSSPQLGNNFYHDLDTPMPLSPQPLLSSAYNGGARPKINYAQDDSVQIRQTEAGSDKRSRIQDRMTQSAILLRDQSENDDRTMSWSLFSPNPGLRENDLERKFMHGTASPENYCAQAKAQEDPVYKRNIRTGENGPDYENILNIQPEINSQRPVEEHEEVFSTSEVHTSRNISSKSRDGRSNIIEGNQTNFNVDMNQNEGSGVSALKICPVCSLEFSRMTMDQFQTHVFECFDNCEEPPTLQNPVVVTEDDRNCPMCGEVFPMTIAQETYEQHVLAHFGEEPMIERFEMLN